MFHKLAPRPYKNWIKNQMMFSGSKKSINGFINTTVLISIVIAVVAYMIAGKYALPVGIGVGICMFVLFNGFLMLAVDRRSRFVENILPDALQLMAANSRAGYIPSRALLLSARPEFGPLSEAIKTVGKEIITGQSLDESLMKVTRYIKSDVVERTMKLIIEGTKAGGQFATLLEENAEDLRRLDIIKKEVQSNIMIYIIFVGFAGVLGAPALYALSTYLIGTITQLGAAAAAPDTGSSVAFLQFGTIDMSPEFLFIFSLAAILITTVFGSFIIGLISSGTAKGGIKYLPVFVVGALGVFFAAQTMISMMFGVIAP
ncbi:MAG: type II secretion system F family protein [Candidatus Aenigmatarchaeota archaeon]|nr:type II secretion system F family protein [Nanoarchaeota archaeon]